MHNADPLKESDQMRVALIFSPAMHPTSPPLGIAGLKGFLQERAPECACKLFDLNLAHHSQALDWMGDGRLKMSLRKMNHSASARAVREACSFFQGRQGLDAFLDLPTYDANASLYESFGTVLNGLFENFARRILLGLPVPSLAESFFRGLIEPVRAFRPRLAGFSILFSQQLYFSLLMAKYLKEDGCRVVLGGATLSVMPHPERFLTEKIAVGVGEHRGELDVSPLVDYLIIGEGEKGLGALLDQWDGDLYTVPGLVRAENGRERTSAPEMISDLNALPIPDFSDFDLENYHSPFPILPYLSSRGCFWGRCAFCTHQKTYLAYREEAVQRTVSHLSELKERYGVRHFNLVDEMIHPNRFGRLSGAILQKGLQVRYSAYAKPTRSFNPHLLRTMYRSGARVIMWGVESGNQRVIEAMGKGTQVSDMERVLCEAHEVGVWNLLFLLFGFPSETREEWEDTLRLLDRQKESIDALSKSKFVLVAGSEVIRRPERYSIAKVLDRPERDPISVAYDYLVSRGLNQEEVQRLYEEQTLALKHYGRSPYFGQFRDHLLIHASDCLTAV